MQSAAVPCTSNGMKRTAANALLTESETDTNPVKHQHNDYKSETDATSPPPPEKRSFIVVESPLKLDTIDSAEDLDIKVLKIQNKNLSERLIQRKRLEEDLKEKIDILQNRKLADDNKLCTIDRYWTQLDENLRLMLERFDNTSENTEVKPISTAVRNFLAKLNDWDKVEIEDNLKDRVKFTTQTVAKLMTNYDRIRNKDLETSEVLTENARLNELLTKLQQKSHLIGLEKKTLEDTIVKLETEIKELNSKNDSTEYDLEKFRDKAFKLDRQLADTIIKVNNLQKYNQNMLDQQSTSHSTSNSQYDKNGQLILHTNTSHTPILRSESSKSTNLSEKQVNEMEVELEEYKELSTSRLAELEKFNVQYQYSLKQIEKLKADLKLIPESAISESSEYRLLQSKFSLVVSDNIKLKAALDESKVLIETSRVTYQRQLEAMESDELNQQKRLGNEMMQLEEQLTKVRQENELLRIEYEQNVAANEQTGPINKEMRSLITTLQTNNKLLKSDNVRTKKRLEEILQENEKIKKQIAQLQLTKSDVDKTNSKSETDQTATDLNSQKDSSQIKELKEINQKLIEDKKELRSLLDTYKQSNKQISSSPGGKQHRSVELDDAKAEIKRLKDLLERSKSNRTDPSLNVSASNAQSTESDSSQSSTNLAVSEYLKKIKSLDENIRELHKNLSSKKQEETALLNDMEITGQAFEDMQEQNVRLMQQLREKDDANFKLVSERIKLENVEKNLKEEKEIYVQQVLTLQEQLETQMCIAKKLDEQLLLSNQTILIIEKEKAQLQHSCENYRRQAFDHSQLVQDLKLNIQKYLSQLKEVQQQIAEKSEALASQSFINKRSQEEIKHLQMKIERQKKFEMASSMDEVLQEEIKEYKEQLRCPSCKVKQKDAVLTKCFHVFCIDCLQKRYDTRQRKCPKCNANFGANDFRKLYLS